MFARPAVLMALGDIYGKLENRHKRPQLELALAQDCFQVFAGLQGVYKYIVVCWGHRRGCVMNHVDACRCSISHSRCLSFNYWMILQLKPTH